MSPITSTDAGVILQNTLNSQSVVPDETKEIIYKTIFKKGNIVETIYFAHRGNLTSAVEKVKIFLSAKHFRHIHTVPFLLDLDEMNYGEDT